MRFIRAISGTIACAAVSMVASQAFAQGAGCTAINGVTLLFTPGPFSIGPLPFDAGDTLTLTNTIAPGAASGVTLTLTSPFSVVSTVGSTVSGQVPTTGPVAVAGSAAGPPPGPNGSLVTFACVAGTLPTAGAGTPIAQTVTNAETAIRNGQMA